VLESFTVKTTPLLLLAATLGLSLGGCIVAPMRPAYVNGPYDAPAGVAYIGPTYEIPGPGYVWAYHAQFGWGWRHPNHGWHRGWR
jgi:hypothetical protein